MGVNLNWFLPTHGDGRSIVDRPAESPIGAGVPREPDIDYLAQVAQAAERLGFRAVLTPTGTWCQDSWITTAALLARTRTLKFLVAFRPDALTPTLAAQLAATYQRVSGGRLLLNIVTGGDPVEQARFGDYLDHDQRYERTDEFLAIVREIWTGRRVDFTGRHYQIKDATTFAAPDPVPPVFFGGSSDAALEVAAKRADVHLTWGEPPGPVAAQIARLRELADRAGRTVRFGIRLHTISRDTSAEAWAVAQRLYEQIDPEAVRQSQARLVALDGVGQRHMVELHGGALGSDARSLEVSPNLWAGVGLVRGGAGTALVGSYTEVADRIEEYHSVGIDEFILSGYPHLEEAYWFGEGVRPELARRGLLS